MYNNYMPVCVSIDSELYCLYMILFKKNNIEVQSLLV